MYHSIEDLNNFSQHLKPDQGDLHQLEVILFYRNHHKLSSHKFKVGEQEAKAYCSVPIHCDATLSTGFLALFDVKFRLLNGQGCALFETSNMSLDHFHPREILRGSRKLIAVGFRPAARGNVLCPVDVWVSTEPTLLLNGTGGRCLADLISVFQLNQVIFAKF